MPVSDYQFNTLAGQVSTLQSEVDNLTTELGNNPEGAYADVRARLDILEARIGSGGGGGGGNVVFAGDLSGSSTTQTVIGLFNHPLAATTPVQSAVAVWDINSPSVYNIRQLTEDDILPGFAITSFSGGSIVEVGASVVNPTFTASYNSTPTSANITNTDNIDSPLNLVAPYGSGTVVGTFSHNTISSTTFTLTAHKGGISKTANSVISFLARSFGGVGTAGAAGATASGNNANLYGATGTLNNEGLHSSDVGQQYGPFNPSSQKIYICVPHTSTQHQFHDSNGFVFPMLSPTNFSFTNQNGAALSYDLYESVNLLSTSFTLTVVS